MQKRQAGFAMLMAVFFIVVVAATITVFARLSVVQAKAASLGVQSSRLYFAALSGFEWARYQVEQNNVCPAAQSNFQLDVPGAAGIRLEVLCVQRAYNNNERLIWDLTVTAEWGFVEGLSNASSRRIQGTVVNL